MKYVQCFFGPADGPGFGAVIMPQEAANFLRSLAGEEVLYLDCQFAVEAQDSAAAILAIAAAEAEADSKRCREKSPMQIGKRPLNLGGFWG